MATRVNDRLEHDEQLYRSRSRSRRRGRRGGFVNHETREDL